MLGVWAIRVTVPVQLRTPRAPDVVAAAHLSQAHHSQAHQLSSWDAMIVRSATALGCRVLWSEDLTHGQRIGDVEIRNPF